MYVLVCLHSAFRPYNTPLDVNPRQSLELRLIVVTKKEKTPVKLQPWRSFESMKLGPGIQPMDLAGTDLIESSDTIRLAWRTGKRYGPVVSGSSII